jgi:outer membrane lipoprotein-sorting protein
MLRVLFTGILGATLGIAADGLLETTLAKMDQAAATFKDLSADLSRTHHTAVIGENTVDSGTIYIRRPKAHELLMRFDIQKPDAKQVSLDTRRAQIYYPKTQTVQIYDIGKYKRLADQLLLLGFGTTSKELEAAYTVAPGGPELLNDQKMTRIDLTPKSNETHLTKVELWISDTTGLPLQQKLYWPGPNGGDYDLATYSHMRINTNLSDSAVKLNLPSNVKREYPQK